MHLVTQSEDTVAVLVYITGFVPDQGESVETLIADPPPGAPVPPILPPQDGFLFLDREKFPASFAGDLSAEEAAFMADSQVPWGVEALSGTISEPAWRTKPSWYLIATEDRMITPPAQRSMSARAMRAMFCGVSSKDAGNTGVCAKASEIGSDEREDTKEGRLRRL
jgi:hypothetical protein